MDNVEDTAFFRRRTPLAVRLPPDWSKRRRMPEAKPFGRQDPPAPTAAEAAHYDRRTVLYDLWLGRDGRLTGIGPPPMNLAPALKRLRIRLSVAGKPIAEVEGLECTRVSRSVWFAQSAEPVALGVDGPVDAVISLPRGTLAQGRLRQPLGLGGRIVATTLQKDNSLSWIADWLDYLAWHGVGAALLYDNGSDGATDLAAMLAARNRPPAVTLVDWPFPYGPARFPALKFCQEGQLHHARDWLLGAAWMVNLDIDEYPVLPRGARLADYLGAQPETCGTVILQGRAVQARPTDPVGPGRSARDYTQTLVESQGAVVKYATRPAATEIAGIHHTRLRPGFETATAPLAEAFFAHYMPLTTGWNPHYGQSRTARHRLPANAAYAEDRVREILAAIDRETTGTRPSEGNL